MENGSIFLPWRQYGVKRNRSGYGKIPMKALKMTEKANGKSKAVDYSPGFTYDKHLK
jgi:hypothetical protein